MVDKGESTEIVEAFNDLARTFVAKGVSPSLVSGAMVTASVGLVAQSGNPANAGAILRTIADKIDSPTMLLEP